LFSAKEDAVVESASAGVSVQVSAMCFVLIGGFAFMLLVYRRQRRSIRQLNVFGPRYDLLENGDLMSETDGEDGPLE
jgi:hypothetical protein